MRQVWVIIVLLHISWLAFSQADERMDTDFTDYLRENQYVNITDTRNLPYTVKYCQHVIVGYLEIRAENPADYFTTADFLKLTNETISIPLFHIDGVRKRHRLANEEVLVVGNASGKDGEMIINYHEMKVVQFYISQ